MSEAGGTTGAGRMNAVRNRPQTSCGAPFPTGDTPLSKGRVLGASPIQAIFAVARALRVVPNFL